MKTTLKWVLIVGAILLLLVALPALFWMIGGGRYFGMMREFPMMRDFPNMRHSFGFWGPVGWIFMGLRGIIPLALLVFLVLGLTGLVSALFQRPAPPLPPPAPMPAPPPTRTCTNCGKPAQVDWQTCPYCSQPLVQ